MYATLYKLLEILKNLELMDFGCDKKLTDRYCNIFWFLEHLDRAVWKIEWAEPLDLIVTVGPLESVCTVDWDKAPPWFKEHWMQIYTDDPLAPINCMPGTEFLPDFLKCADRTFEKYGDHELLEWNSWLDFSVIIPEDLKTLKTPWLDLPTNGKTQGVRLSFITSKKTTRYYVECSDVLEVLAVYLVQALEVILNNPDITNTLQYELCCELKETLEDLKSAIE